MKSLWDWFQWKLKYQWTCIDMNYEMETVYGFHRHVIVLFFLTYQHTKTQEIRRVCQKKIL